MAESLFAACAGGDLQRATQCIQNGAIVNQRNSFGSTPLHMAAFYNYPEITQLLIRWGADVNARDYSGFTPLDVAINQNKTGDTVQILIRYGAGVNAKGNNDNTPLHVACYLGDELMVKLLLSAGACIHAKNASGKTPADRTYRKEIAALLLAEGGKCGCPPV